MMVEYVIAWGSLGELIREGEGDYEYLSMAVEVVVGGWGLGGSSDRGWG